MPVSDPLPIRPRARFHWLLLAGVFLCIFSVRLLLIDRFGGDLPMVDQWGKEADWIIGPMREGQPWLARFLAPHNEHRIYWTLAVDVGLTQLSGQWDARVQAVASAVLHAAIMTWLASLAARWLAGPPRWTALAAALALAVAPLAWENITWGFQSQFYFLIGFSLAAMVGLLTQPTGSPRWWLSVAAGLSALVTMGSGWLWPVPVLLILVARRLARQTTSRDFLINASVCAIALACGWWLAFIPPWHDDLRASGIGDFVRYAAHCFSWPLTARWWPMLLWYLPLGVWLVLHARQPRTLLRPGPALACVLWCGLHVAALAYARGIDGGVPASRYGDVFAIGVFGNAVLGGALMMKKPASLLVRTAGTVWVGLLIAALVWSSFDPLRRGLPGFQWQMEDSVHATRTYLQTNDPRTLAAHSFPDKAWLQRTLDRPGVREVLPSSVWPAGQREPSLLSAATLALVRNAGWLAFAGLALIAGGIFAAQRSRTAQIDGRETTPPS